MPEGTQTPAAGGVLTQQQVATLLLQPLQAASLFLSSGVTIFDTNGGNSLRIPRLTGSTGAAWVAEAGPIPDDDVTFGELILLPKNMQSLKVITKVSDELLRQSIVALDQVLRARLVSDVAASLDTELIAGTVTDGTKPRGLLNQANIQTIVHSATNAAVTLDLLHDMVGKLLTANVDPSGARWMVTPFVFVALRKLNDAQNRYQLQPDPTEAGKFRLLGFPVTVTPRIPVASSATKIVLWIPKMYAVARDIAPEVKVLDQTYAGTGQVGIRVQARYDAAPMYPESVVVATGVTGA